MSWLCKNPAMLSFTARNLTRNKHTKESKPEKHKANSAKDNMESDTESLGLVTQALIADVCDNNVETWIVDSGFTCYMFNDQELMDDFVKLEKLVEVQLGNGKVLNETGRGKITLFTVLPWWETQEMQASECAACPKVKLRLTQCLKSY